MIIGIGFILRLSGIRYGLPSKNKALTTYHPDEALSFYTIEKWKPSKFYFHPDRVIQWGGAHLFPMALTLKLAELVGYVHIPSRKFLIEHLEEADKIYKVSRFFEIFFGTLSIFILFLIGYRNFDWVIGIFSAIFLCFSAAHIVNSFLTRPDALMVCLALFSLLFSLRVWQRPKRRDSIIAGIFLGLAAATKYSAAPYGIFPLLIHLFSCKENRKNFLFFLLASSLTFFVSIPYLILDFPWFYKNLLLNIKLSQALDVPGDTTPTWIRYFTYFLPYGLGWPLTLTGFIGWLCFAMEVFYKLIKVRFLDLQDRLKLIMVAGSLIVYMVVTRPSFQVVWYTLPVIPLIAFFSAVFFKKIIFFKPTLRWFALFVLAFHLFYTMTYSFAYLSLFRKVNVREQASEWIGKNIAFGKSIGIIRSYYWTPGILRQYQPPYELLKAGDDETFVDDAVLSFESVSQKADYLVLSEFELRNYTNPKIMQYYPKQAKILEKIMEKDFKEIRRFDQEAEFFGFHFSKGDLPPLDWILPNPTIRIFEKNY